jgi:feruloyl-CoA synthase
VNDHAAPARIPFRPIDFLPRDIDVERRPDGTIVLRNRVPLQAYERHIPAFLRRWAREAPDRVFIAQRRGTDRAWKTVTYGEALATVDRLTQALLDLNLTEQRPVMVLSGNSIEHALLMMAAMQARAPIASISPAYSLMSQDYAKLKYVFELLQPGLVMVQNGPMFAKALGTLDVTGVTVVHVDGAVPGHSSVPFETLAATPETDAVQRSIDAIAPDTIGKFLFTSGSTGFPKAVINTQAMMCANVGMGQQCIRRSDSDEPAVTLGWLPWSHTAGGNAGLHSVLAGGGTLYLDDGRPLPGQFDETIRNLREIETTSFSNVPAGFAALLTVLERDEALCRTFFKKLKMLAYGGATLPGDLYARMQALAVKYTGHRIVFYTAWGSTETAPSATSTFWPAERAGLIGLPHPGVELKMVPITTTGGSAAATADGQKYELRLRSVIVTPGYWKRPDLTAGAFDEDGFYKIGDAGAFVDPNDPAQGLIFAGRVVEDFKLTSGTFVHVGSLRVAAITAASPVLQDGVVTGQDRVYAGLLAWPNLMACRQLMGNPDATATEAVVDQRVIATMRAGLAAHNAANRGSSTQIRRVILMAEPASIDGGELTDKGYVNQRGTLDRRAALVEKLYDEPPGPEVITID